MLRIARYVSTTGKTKSLNTTPMHSMWKGRNVFDSGTVKFLLPKLNDSVFAWHVFKQLKLPFLSPGLWVVDAFN